MERHFSSFSVSCVLAQIEDSDATKNVASDESARKRSRRRLKLESSNSSVLSGK